MNQNAGKTECYRGHNDWHVRPSGARRCRTCARIDQNVAGLVRGFRKASVALSLRDYRVLPDNIHYAISSDGYLLNLLTGAESRGRLSGHGYRKTHVVNQYMHTLVASAFLGPRPDGTEVCHRDGNGLNNDVANLYYGTRSENMLDSVRHGTCALLSQNRK